MQIEMISHTVVVKVWPPAVRKEFLREIDGEDELRMVRDPLTRCY